MTPLPEGPDAVGPIRLAPAQRHAHRGGYRAQSSVSSSDNAIVVPNPDSVAVDPYSFLDADLQKDEGRAGGRFK